MIQLLVPHDRSPGMGTVLDATSDHVNEGLFFEMFNTLNQFVYMAMSVLYL